jgi:hypothetical protein
MKSWADALDEAIEMAIKRGASILYCPLCRRGRHVKGVSCLKCPVGGDGSYARGEAMGYPECDDWGRMIKDGNRTALKRARQLSAYIRKHPREWQHMDPKDLAREVRKVTP